MFSFNKAFILLIVCFVIAGKLTAKTYDFSELLLSPTDLKIITEKLTAENPDLVDRPAYVNTIQATVKKDTNFVLSLYRFSLEDEEKLYIVGLMHTPLDKKIIGYVDIDDVFTIKDKGAFYLRPLLYELNTDNWGVFFVYSQNDSDDHSNLQTSSSYLISFGDKIKVLANLPTSCSYSSNVCKDSANTICDYNVSFMGDISPIQSQSPWLEFKVSGKITKKVTEDGVDNNESKDLQALYKYDSIDFYTTNDQNLANICSDY